MTDITVHNARVSARANEKRDGIELTFHGSVGETTVYFNKRHAHDIINAVNEALSEM